MYFPPQPGSYSAVFYPSSRPPAFVSIFTSPAMPSAGQPHFQINRPCLTRANNFYLTGHAFRWPTQFQINRPCLPRAHIHSTAMPIAGPHFTHPHSLSQSQHPPFHQLCFRRLYKLILYHQAMPFAGPVFTISLGLALRRPSYSPWGQPITFISSQKFLHLTPGY